MQYFKHMTGMRNDVKIKRLIAKHGLQGYGLYNLIIETIAENITTSSPLPELQETCEDIAAFYNGNTAQINDIMAFMINQGLFELDEITGRVLCKKIYKFLEQSQTRSLEIRNLIESYRIVNDCPGQSQTNMIEKNRKEQNRKEYNNNDSFNEFWNLYDKKVNPKVCKQYWNKINPDLHGIIFKHVADYVKNTPDKKYRKDPERYLKHELWQSEIIPKDESKNNNTEWWEQYATDIKKDNDVSL